jgi:hypothetical protein
LIKNFSMDERKTIHFEIAFATGRVALTPASGR